MGHTKPTCVNDVQWGQVTGVQRVLCVTDMKVVLFSFPLTQYKEKNISQNAKQFICCVWMLFLLCHQLARPCRQGQPTQLQSRKQNCIPLLCSSVTHVTFHFSFLFFFLLCWVTGCELALYTIFIAMWEGQKVGSNWLVKLWTAS